MAGPGWLVLVEVDGPGCLFDTIAPWRHGVTLSPSAECFRILRDVGLNSTCDACRPKLAALVGRAPHLAGAGPAANERSTSGGAR